MKRCLICGNGPSLRDVRNDTLDRFVTFGGNWIYQKYEPTYYVFVDPMIGNSDRRFLDEISGLKSIKYISSDFADLIPDSISLNCIHRKGFSYEPLDHIYTYFSVTTAMVQLAYAMGFDLVGLVGMDHRYHEPLGKRTFHPAEMDQNHFAEDYYQGRLRYWKAPRLDLLAEWFELAKGEFEKSGREIVNLTPNSALKMFRFERIEDWL